MASVVTFSNISNMKENNPNKYNLILDYKGLLSVFWKDKFLILSFILLSIPVGINYISKKPPIYSATAIIDVSESSKVTSQSILPTANPIFQFQKQSISFLPKVTGTEFLKTVIFSNKKLEKNVRELCDYSEVKPSFIRNLLISTGVSSNLKPNEQQKDDLLISCIRDLMVVKEYTHDGTFLTPAHSISVESTNPFFAADLVNEIVVKFFDLQKLEGDRHFQKLARQLSSMIEDAQLAINETEKKLENFTIRHAGLIVKDSSYIKQSNEADSLRLALRNQIYKLGQSERYDVDLKDLVSRLRQASKEDIGKINDLVQTIGITGGLSNEFVSSISEAQRLDLNSLDEENTVLTIFEKEIFRLNTLLKRNERQLASKEIKVEGLMELSNELNRLEMAVNSKKAYLNTLEAQLASNALESGLMKLKEGQLLTRATPPLYPIGPNKKRIMALFVIAFTIVAISISLLKQTINNRVYHIGQLHVLGALRNLVQLSHRRKWFFDSDYNKKDMKSQFDFKFFSELLISGGIGCVVDVRSNKKSRLNVAEEVCSQIGHAIFRNEKCMLLFQSDPKKSLLLNSESGKNGSNLKNQKINHADEENLFIQRVNRSEIENLDVSSLRSQLKEYSRIVISLDHTIDDAVKMKLMTEVDYYILVGIAGIVGLKTLRKFVQISGEEKCLVFAS